MLLIKLLILCEQSKDRSTISFRTKNFQGDLAIESGNVIRVAGLDPDLLKQALFEEALEVFIKKTPDGISSETRLPISALAVETAAYLHESLENKTSFSSLVEKPRNGLFQETALVDKNGFGIEPLMNPSVESKNLALRKTINVDLKSINLQGSGESQQKPQAILLHFKMGVPEKKTMGRSQDCEIVVNAGDASRKHCELTFTGKNLIVKDLGSSNGTFLNSRVVIESNASNNDILHLGSTAYMIVIE
jgi:hypothetical protein